MAILDITTLKQYFNLADYPVSITGLNGLATITLTNHNFKTGDYLNVTGTTDFDGLQLVTRTGPNALTFVHAYTGTKSGVIKQNDFLLNSIINTVEHSINTYCNMIFGQVSSAVEYQDLTIDGIIYPKRGQLGETDVTSILLSRENNFTDSTKYITLTASDYFLYEDRIELLYETCAPYLNCKRAVKLTYTTQAVPEGIKSAALKLAEFHFRISNDKSIHESGRSINGEQRNFLGDVPHYIIDELDKYKRYTIGKPF